MEAREPVAPEVRGVQFRLLDETRIVPASPTATKTPLPAATPVKVLVVSTGWFTQSVPSSELTMVPWLPTARKPVPVETTAIRSGGRGIQGASAWTSCTARRKEL